MACTTPAWSSGKLIFIWLSVPEKFTKKACAEFYCREIPRKFSLKFPQYIINLEKLI